MQTVGQSNNIVTSCDLAALWVEAATTFRLSGFTAVKNIKVNMYLYHMKTEKQVLEL